MGEKKKKRCYSVVMNYPHTLLYEWLDKDVKRVSTWSKAVRKAMHQGGAEFQRQRVLTKAATTGAKKAIPVRGLTPVPYK
jgi:hypothetical protein